MGGASLTERTGSDPMPGRPSVPGVEAGASGRHKGYDVMSHFARYRTQIDHLSPTAKKAHNVTPNRVLVARANVPAYGPPHARDTHRV